jgi:ATP-dependent Clp protease protease subunit
VKPFKENIERSLLITGEVTQESLNEVVPLVMRLDEKVHRDGIHIYLTSPGGQGTAGMALYDFLKSRKNDITVIAQGECSSVAALVMQAADRRLISPHSRMLLHFGHVDMSNKGSVDADTLIRSGEEVRRLDEMFVDIMWGGSNSATSRSQVYRLLQRNTFITANQALALGFVDAITCTPNYKRNP